MLDNHDVHSQFHPMARRDFYSDRNVQESSAEGVQPDKEASMNSLKKLKTCMLIMESVIMSKQNGVMKFTPLTAD